MSKNNIEDIYPLAPVQDGMLFHTLYAPEAGIYFMQFTCTFQGDLHAPALEQAWQQTLDRHPVLRTGFMWQGRDKPLQVVRRQVGLPWAQEDWRGLSPDEQQARLASFLRSDRVRGFELSTPPLMRMTLIQIADDAYRFIWSYHHLLLDGWSMSLVLKEAFAFYEAFRQGKDVHLERNRPYRDYIAWLHKQDLSKAKPFWQRTLKGFSAPTPLGVDRSAGRSLDRLDGHGEHEIKLSPEATAALESFARQHRLTLNTLMQGAWALLLSHYSGEEDVLFGAVVSGRPPDLVGVESMVGPFINTLPVRVQVVPDNPLLAWLRRLQAQQVEVRQYEYSPLVQVQGWSEVPRKSPLFESVLVFVNYPIDSPWRERRQDLKILNVRSVEKTNFSLMVVAKWGPQLGLLFCYDRGRFETETIMRLGGHLERLLEGMVAHSGRRLADVPLLSDTEQRRMLVEWNATETVYPQQTCVHELFATRAAQRPEAVAVVCEDHHVTYAALNRRANQLAHYLRRLGVGPEVLVGICMERSPEMVIGLLGILKAGGAYVPLDPAYPKERLAFMLRDAQTPVLLTQRRWAESLAEHKGHLLCLDTDWGAVTKERDENPASETTGDHLAYAIYTSGSTGKPKGAMNTQRGLCNRLLWMQEAYGLTPADRVLQKTPFSFDVSVWEFWWPLLTGACLVLARPGGHQDSTYLVGQIVAQQITTLHFVPSMLQIFLEEPGLERCRSLRRVMCSGETLPFALQERFYARLSAELHNLYGPTEASIDVTFWACERPARRQTVPIGRPIANTQIYLLDAHGQPAPVGVPGELYIGGVGLARGYLRRPDLTAERFVPDPFSRAAGARLYKTGDLTRYGPGGEIEYLGRIDHQVKIRGYRVEPGEIEKALSRHEAIRDVLVLARSDVTGDPRLVAYLVPNPEAKPTVDNLRRFLRERLPEYMGPAAFVMLEALPLTSNGKVDRRALPPPDAARPGLEEIFVAPQTSTEEMLASIWAELLHFDRVGRHDDFFDLGGESLLAMRVISQIRRVFQIDLSLRTFFEQSTVAGLAGEIEKVRQAEQGRRPLPMRPIAREEELPLSFAQQRLWFLDQFGSGRHFYNIPCVMRLRGRLNRVALEQSLSEIVRRHEALRTVFPTVDGRPVQVITPAMLLVVPQIDLSQIPTAEREAWAHRLVNEEVRRPFDLAAGPLLRVVLLRLDDQAHLLLLTMHHIISDGWSRGVLLRELQLLYGAFCSGKPSPLPELTIQYADFSAWQREWLAGEVLNDQLSYWRQQLDNAPTVLRLPADRPRPAVQTFRGATHVFRLSVPLTQALKQLSRREHVTLFMTLLAAFKTLLHCYTGQEDILVGTPVANRNRLEVEGLIGFFANTLVLHTDLSGHPSFRELLSRVRKTVLDAFAHQDLPFERLVEELQIERDLSRNPLFQVVFTLQNAERAAPELSGLTLSSVAVDSETAKFDLMLVMEDSEKGLSGALEYNTDLFDRETIMRLGAHLERLLEGIVAHPERPLADLPLLADAEQRRLLVEWNATETAYPKQSTVHELFAAQAALRPEAIAVVCQDHQITYAVLNRRANQLAHYLRRLGVGPEVPVGLCVERSVETIVAILGILKAGGAYVPLDPAYPKERLAYMVADTGMTVLLTQAGLWEPRLAPKVQVLCLDTDRDRLARESPANPISHGTAENLAYVMYTSGSTGQPKGIGVPHRGVVRLVLQTNYVKLTPEEVFLQGAPLAFDAATFEIWGTLLHGARLAVLPARIPSLEELGQALRQYQVTTLWLTAGLFHQMVETDLEAFGPVRQLLAGGDVLSASHVQRVLDQARGCCLINGYGPTEGTTFTCCNPMTHTSSVGHTVSIGRPIANTQVYILNPRLKPVPIGVTGELYIGGDGLARGYWGQPALTADRFIPHPFSREPGARLYGTGDLTRWLRDGTIEFLGRRDSQVKIRGFRIELGEVEAVLGQHTALREAVVIDREDTPGDRRLVAYVVANPGPAPTVNDLRRFMKEKLPAFTIPEAFVLLERLPLTPNGKVDRRSLPEPEDVRPTLETVYREPRNELERRIAAVWQEVLRIDRVGVHDNFFDLGGNSLHMVRAKSKLQEALNREIGIIDLFKDPTVSALAERLSLPRNEPPTLQQVLDRASARRASLRRQKPFRKRRPASERQEVL